MCGIAGFIKTELIVEGDRRALESMLARLRHRGPDGAGQLEAERLVMGMVRLSIIDLEGGQQPLYNEDRSVGLVANGEIYNFVELREELKQRGHRFATGSDCEVIVHLYEEHGDACVDHLRGMFAFALWDEARQRVLLARDRMGEKPLYLYEIDGALVFASELRGLLASGRVPFELDPAGVNDYFHYSYTPDPGCPVRGVRKLPAGHVLVVEPKPWRLNQRCYWDLESVEPIPGDPTTTIRARLDDIGRQIIRADVPVGVALSGGLDSSLIAAVAARHYEGELQAFSAGYPGQHDCDERAAAKELADHLGIRFHSVEIDQQQMLDDFPKLVEARDDPIADISGQGYYAVCRAAREAGVPVLLQGHGGDELFWGYPWTVQALSDTLRKRHLLQRRWLGRLAYARSVSAKQVGGRRAWLRCFGGLRHAPRELRRDLESPPGQMVFYDITPDFDRVARETPSIYVDEFAAELNGRRPHDLFTFPEPWPRADITATRLLIDIYLRENGIAQGDRLSMANSVELRLPLVDHRLVEAAIGLRLFEPDHGLPAKTRLRDAASGLLPDWVLNRPKRGFSPPTHDWVNALVARYGGWLVDGYLVESNVLRPEVARRLVQDGIQGFEIMPLVFKALVLETWCRLMTGSLQPARGLVAVP